MRGPIELVFLSHYSQGVGGGGGALNQDLNHRVLTVFVDGNVKNRVFTGMKLSKTNRF